MFHDPGINITQLPVMEQMRQMTFNRPSTQIGNYNQVNVYGLYGDQCPILGLPNELISAIFSLLPPKDRLRARVNKRLNAIEAKSK
ncbi:hypothetical protein PMAYCL1PPCAC_00535 [Pristionchus mayeri]|uniref:F-box domain-containing protein n=1 Tax=Pristionchus mayeri TaxID=1317129 RepID=A0AAN4Z317_9BILA|nr:hypothetical protein PMAYCL1PPCAC_00535 [Pristionchus mayeri]